MRPGTLAASRTGPHSASAGAAACAGDHALNIMPEFLLKDQKPRLLLGCQNALEPRYFLVPDLHHGVTVLFKLIERFLEFWFIRLRSF